MNKKNLALLLLAIYFAVPVIGSGASYVYSLGQDLDVRNRTGNEVLFSSQEDVYTNVNSNEEHIVDFMNDWVITKGKETNNNFSHDNWKGAASWSSKFRPEYLDDVPLFGRHSSHPINFLTFLYFKNRALGTLYLPLISTSMILPTIIPFKRDHLGRPHTSGRILDYMVCKSLGMKITFSALTYYINRTPEFGGWDGVFNIYFKKDHRVSVAYYRGKVDGD